MSADEAFAAIAIGCGIGLLVLFVLVAWDILGDWWINR